MIEPWLILGERPGTAGYLPITVRTYALPDGSTADWDIFGVDRVVAVLAITDAEEVVLVRQFRPGPGTVLAELPGGAVGGDEEVVDAARRELLEETGYAGEVEVVASSWLASASRTRRYIAVARGARCVSPPTPDPTEFCEVSLIALGAFRDHLRSGQLTDVDLGYLALDHLGALEA